MRRVTLQMEPRGEVVTWKCKSASYGDRSVNLILRGAEEPPPNGTKHEMVLIPLQMVRMLTEDEW